MGGHVKAQALPPEVVSLDDHRTRALARLDPNAAAYLGSAAGDGHTADANRAAWDGLRLWPRVLQPLAGLHTQVELLGRRLAHPVLLAPLAYQRLFDDDGELASAIAAAAQGAGFALSTLSSVSLETVAAAVCGDAGRGPLWFQLYFQRDRGRTLDLVQRAEAAGYEALVFTVDAPVNGVRDGERRAGFRLPPGVIAANLPAAAGPASLAELLATAPGWADLDWLLGATRLPVLVKGVLHPADARAAVAAGAAGLIVSNHGGRTLDGAPATASALPAIVAAAGGAVPVLVDGGIRRGTDVLKALALGARAVLIGRPLVWGLASAGAMGVAHVIRLLRDELEAAMALCGLASLASLSRDLALSGHAVPQPPWRHQGN
ncbi:alpha-hydroxy acid oxidase [Ramlibacter tataouinensis]|uniref:alpha-hydroxy acid oxidase n=1 Tax=Ramlibacter tataouinensis TaxID=94132 RepID=UPI0022F3CDDF|nr:alpha-hydroxy acid oxidase [Ramlibacter tataouinensis]WBY01679.1 alpha-hydroxy acid oxidase [Ramlibacter tataouinensis]